MKIPEWEKAKHRKMNNSEYKQKLSEIYGEYIRVARGSMFTDMKECIDHLCKFCGTTTSVKPATMLGMKKRRDKEGKENIEYVRGRGCSYCRTTADHIEDLQTFLVELENIHGTKYRFANLPAHFEAKTPHRHYFICTTCGQQHLHTPMNMLRREFKCGVCEKVGRSTINVLYQKRLDDLYDKKVTRVGNYHSYRPFLHECREGHTWKSTVSRLLSGYGCSKCEQNPRSVSKSGNLIFDVSAEYQNQKFEVRTRMERTAVMELARKVKYPSFIKTSKNYPIPSLYKRTIPAFFHRKQNLIVDVFSRKKLQGKINRIQRSLNRATELGYRYGLIVVDGKTAVGVFENAEIQKLIAE